MAGRIHPLLLMFGVIMAIGWIITLAFFVVDPLDLYPWGVQPKLKGADYSMDATPYLVDVVAKNPDIDTLFIGGSTGHPFSAKLMEELLPGTRHAFNLTYTSPRPADREAVEAQILKYAHPRRVLFELDWRFQLPKALERSVDVTGNGFPIFFYDDTLWNDVRGIGLKTARLTWVALEGQPLWLPSWNEKSRDEGLLRHYQAFQSPRSVAAYKSMVERHRSDIDTPSSLSCADLDVVNDDVAPFARTLAERNVEVDVIIPVYSLLLYYEWIDRYERLSVNGASFMNDQLLVRRCVITALDKIPNVRIFAFDNLPGLADDMRNYRDPGHLYNDAVIRYILRSIAAGTNRLTRENVEAEIAKLHHHIVNYQVTDSQVWQAQPE